jgi:hypothetical protein
MTRRRRARSARLGRRRLRRRRSRHQTPAKQPADGKRLAVTNRSVNDYSALRWQGKRGFAILTGRWKTLRHCTVSPRRIGDIVAAALHLIHFEYRYLPSSC